MNMKRYKLRVAFEFTGEFRIEADSLVAARQYVLQHCGLTIGTVHSTLPADQVDWSFSCHPTKKIGKGGCCEKPITEQE